MDVHTARMKYKASIEAKSVPPPKWSVLVLSQIHYRISKFDTKLDGQKSSTPGSYLGCLGFKTQQAVRWPQIILNVLAVCVFVSRGFWWQDLEKCALTGEILVPALRRTFLNSNYRSIVQVRLLKLVLLTGQRRFWKMKICIYKYIAFLAQCIRKGRVCLWHEWKYESGKECGQWT